MPYLQHIKHRYRNKKMEQGLVTSGRDPYADHGSRTAQDGTFLTFSKGEYLAGQAKTELRLNTRLVANMPGLRTGWKRWKDGKVTEDRTYLVSEGRLEEPRSDLGHADDSMWELDDDGNPRDPWVLTNVLEMADPNTGELYVFTTNSAGGRRAIGKLCKDYARAYRMRPGMLPVVELDRDSYMHKNPRFGKIYNPVFRIVDWTDEDAPSASDDDAGQRAVNPTVGQRKLVGFTPDENPDGMTTTPSRSDQPRF